MFPIEKLKAQKEKARQWAEEYLNSEEGKKEIEKWNKEAIEYIILDKPTSCLNEELLDEIYTFAELETFTKEQIIKKFGHLLKKKTEIN